MTYQELCMEAERDILPKYVNPAEIAFSRMSETDAYTRLFHLWYTAYHNHKDSHNDIIKLSARAASALKSLPHHRNVFADVLSWDAKQLFRKQLDDRGPLLF